MDHITQTTQNCIDECNACHDTCMSCIDHCLTLGGAHAEVGHIRTMMDCAEICRTAADFMLRGSLLHGAICRACSIACAACAHSCRSLVGAHPDPHTGRKDSMMEDCANRCESCAGSCDLTANSAELPRVAA